MAIEVCLLVTNIRIEILAFQARFGEDMVGQTSLALKLRVME